MRDISTRFKVDYYDHLKHFRKMVSEFPDLSFETNVFFNILENGLMNSVEQSIEKIEQEKTALIIQHSQKD